MPRFEIGRPGIGTALETFEITCAYDELARLECRLGIPRLNRESGNWIATAYATFQGERIKREIEFDNFESGYDVPRESIATFEGSRFLQYVPNMIIELKLRGATVGKFRITTSGARQI